MTPATRLMLVIWAVCLLAAPVFADLVIFDVALDTSAVSSSSGAIYMQFSPGLNSDPASVGISSFLITGGGSLSNSPPPAWTGDVTGSLDPLPLVLANTSGLNDYLHYLTYGDSIQFRVQFTLPSPLVGNAGSAFAFGLTSDDGFSPILTSDPAGFMGVISYDYLGAFTVDTLSDSATIISSSVPEPSALVLLVTALGLAVMPRRRG